MFRVRILQTPEVMERLATKGPAVIEALIKRMTLLMFKLQSKIVGETLPSMFIQYANIASSVRANPAVIEGTVIKGSVEAGGPRTTKETLGGPNAGQLVDYAGVQEAGVAHSWTIRPVLDNTAWALSQKKRVLSVRGLPKALAFLLNGKLVIVKSVLHPPLRERPFMRQSLADMSAQIEAELNEELTRQLA